jgi:soluble lytic murein transglycosylase
MTPWVEAVRLQHWAKASELGEKLTEQQQQRPEVQYARARVAIKLGDYVQAVAWLRDLEVQLPALTKDIVSWRALAALEAGPFAEAAAYFGRSKKATELVRAALALERDGSVQAARKMIDKAITTAQKTKERRVEAEARGLRARLADASGQKITAGADFRWIALNAPHLAEKTASEQITKAKKTLSAKEQLAAIDAMIDRGATSAALALLTEIETKPGVAKLAVLEARARALFKQRDFTNAVSAYKSISAMRQGAAPEPLYYAARSLSRSDQVDEAIQLYATIAKRFPRTFYGQRAAFLRARLLVQVGRFADAVKAYNGYTASYPRGEDRRDAEYEKTLAMLSSDKPTAARARLKQLIRTARGDDTNKLRELEALAGLRSGDRDGAIRTWTEIVRDQPLSWAAMAARSRLIAANAPAPPMLEPATMQAAVAPLELRLPAVPALLAGVGLDTDAESYLAADEKSAVVAYAGREGEALCGMYGMLASAKRRYRVGAASVSYATLKRAPSEADRWAWECLYPRPYVDQVRALEAEYELPKNLIYAIMRQESAFDAQVVSPASAVGLMQIMPATAQRIAEELSIKVDLNDLKQPDVSLRLGAFYVGKLLKMFGGNIMLAAAAYNAGPTAVTDWLAGDIEHEADLWVARIPYDETRNYVARVVGNLARYQWLDGGDSAVIKVPMGFPKDARASADAY